MTEEGGVFSSVGILPVERDRFNVGSNPGNSVDSLSMKRSEKKGFTLIELMIVVTVIGVLAAVAIPAYSRYVKRSRTAEALTNIRKIYDGEMAYYQDEHTDESGHVISKSFVFCRPQPASKPGKQKRQGDWTDQGWPDVRFSADSPVLYTYLVEVDPEPAVQAAWTQPGWIPTLGFSAPAGSIAAFAARAVGDQDEDSKMSEFIRIGQVKADGTIEGGAGVYTLDPDE